MRVKLSAYEGLVSRSQARRLLAGLDAYTRIVFDFKGVDGIGQAYADEIFRVFPNQQPQIRIDYVNAGPATVFMIERARKVDR